MTEPSQTEMVESMYGNFHCWRDDLTTRQLRQFSAHTRNELAMLRHIVRPGDNVIDIGAHIGTFAIPMARFVGEQGKVHAIEGCPDNFSLLEKNIACNFLESSIDCHNGIVSEKATFFIQRCADSENTGSHYFLPGEGSDGTDGINIDRWLNAIAKETTIDLVKIDIEGAELSALRSARQLIADQHPTLYIEIASQQLQRFGHSIGDIEQFFEPMGYHYFRNIGRRNSNDDSFEIAPLAQLTDGGSFFDLLAVHPSSAHYPRIGAS